MPPQADPLIRFLRGELSWRDLPEELVLPDSLWQQMNELWQRSVARIAEGQVREWGGVLVLDDEGHLHLVDIVQGSEDRVQLTAVSRKLFVGSFHTHPYADGTTGIAFSGADIADIINSRELISLVQSGRDVYMIIRTDETPDHVDRASLKERHNALHWEYLARDV